ncbi:MAG: YkgJ family cysteine cluster protein [Pseudomonadota bacterium]
MDCRANCGACCTAPSINSPLPGMPNGKPAGVACIHLLNDFKCAIFNMPERPTFCASLQPSEEMCGTSRNYAILWLTKLERLTAPNKKS